MLSVIGTPIGPGSMPRLRKMELLKSSVATEYDGTALICFSLGLSTEFLLSLNSFRWSPSKNFCPFTPQLWQNQTAWLTSKVILRHLCERFLCDLSSEHSGHTKLNVPGDLRGYSLDASEAIDSILQFLPIDKIMI